MNCIDNLFGIHSLYENVEIENCEDETQRNVQFSNALFMFLPQTFQAHTKKSFGVYKYLKCCLVFGNSKRSRTQNF